jgi:hypothetical protein
MNASLLVTFGFASHDGESVEQVVIRARTVDAAWRELFDSTRTMEGVARIFIVAVKTR